MLPTNRSAEDSLTENLGLLSPDHLLETFLIIVSRGPDFDPNSACIGTPCRVDATTQHQVSHAQPRPHKAPAASGASSKMTGKLNTVATEHDDYCMSTPQSMPGLLQTTSMLTGDTERCKSHSHHDTESVISRRQRFCYY